MISEIPGITEDVIAFSEEVVGPGLTVVMPHLFGTAPSSESPWRMGGRCGRPA